MSPSHSLSHIRVLVVDDSALMRKIMEEILTRERDIEFVGAAPDPYSAWEKIQRLRPDVLTLDVEMPKMDGLTFLEKLMRAHPIPVVMVSSLTERGCDISLRALELGAVEIVTKPKLDVARGTGGMAAEIVAKVRAAAVARVGLGRSRIPPSAPPPTVKATRPALSTTHKIVAIGASTGGTEALREVLAQLPADFPGIAIVQHMPEHFTSAFARRLDGLCRLHVTEARDGDKILPGHALLAPGNSHMEIVRSGADHAVRVFRGEPVNHHRPSVDVLFHSCAASTGANAVGLIMTGMGGDGARGLLAMRQAGARTIAQDESTCVVFGMPKEAIALGAVECIEPLPLISAALHRVLRRG